MARYYFRIITDCRTWEVEQTISKFLHALPGVTDVYIASLIPYWKNSGQSEISASFDNRLSLAEIQAMLANRWESDTADARWSSIYVPHAIFLWLSC